MPLDAPIRRLEASGSALADEVYAVLCAAILDGRLSPGERVRDVEVADQLGISRTPVREAMQRLELQGLVEVSAHRYTRVTDLDEQMTAEAIEYVGYLAGVLLRMGLSRADDDTHIRLVEMLDEVVAAAEADDCVQVFDTAADFYTALTRVSGNRLFHSVMRESGATVRRFLAGWQPDADDSSARVDSYRRLRLAVAERDIDAAERIVRAQHAVF